MAFQKPEPQSNLDNLNRENIPVVKPTGFREYDARWWFGHPATDREPEINLKGIEAVGLGLGTYLQELGNGPEIVVGHDYRSYSPAIKTALVAGLIKAGAHVKDIGLALSPTAYFAQFALDVPSVAMVTASHNDNGWTGIKMGADRPITFGPQEMTRLKELVLNAEWREKDGGRHETIEHFSERYIADLANRPHFKRKIKAVVACGNGTAGAFAPNVLSSLGIEVIPLNTELDHRFPNHNPDPENIVMLQAMAAMVSKTGADIAFGFDGDGDRCGIVDNEGNEILADKIGVLLAREISADHDNKQFVVDMKSTGLFASDPVLKKHGAKTEYIKSGHSYIKKRMREINAIAAFEKSGHFFFADPIGRGYDDGILAAIAVCDMLERWPGLSMADLGRTLQKTYDGPPRSVFCSDETKYQISESIISEMKRLQYENKTFAGQAIDELILINGVRVISSDNSWGLIRASSNEPKLVLAAESPISAERRDQMFTALETVVQKTLRCAAK